jgi:hypothetical protein
LSAAGKLKYQIGGSVSSDAIASVGGFTEVSLRDGRPEFGATHSLNGLAMDAYTRFVRKPGDIDILPMHRVAFYSVPDMEALQELNGSMKSVLNSFGIGQHIFASQQVERAAALRVGGRDVFVSHPIDSLGYKLVFSLKMLGDVNPAKLTGDFEHLLSGVSAIWPREKLLQSSARILDQEREDPVQVLPSHLPQYNGPLKDFVDDMIALRPDARFLPELNLGHHLNLAAVRIMSRFEDPADKKFIADIIGKNHDLLDRWTVDLDSKANLRTVAEEIVQRQPEYLRQIDGLLVGSPASEVARHLRLSSGVMREVAMSMPRSAIEWKPRPSTAMNILMSTDTKHIRAAFGDGRGRKIFENLLDPATISGAGRAG